MYGQDEYIGLEQDVFKTSSEDEDEKRLQDECFPGFYNDCYIWAFFVE